MLADMDATALRWVLAIIGIVVIAGVYLFSQHQNRIRRQGAIKTFTQDELDNDLIEDEHLRQELSSISTKIDQEDLHQEMGDIKINPALDANIKKTKTEKPAVKLPSVMQQISNDKLVAHVLKHADDQLLTGMDLESAFKHIGLQVDDDGYARLQEYPGERVLFADMTESGSFSGISDQQFHTYGIVCLFDISACEQPRSCYELMLKKVDELVRMLDLKVYNENLQLLTLQHVTETRDKLKAASSA